MKVNKIRVFPTKEQDVKFKKWLGAARWTYNQCVEYYKQCVELLETRALRAKMTKKAFQKALRANMTKKALRARCVNKNALTEHEWVTDIPYDIRDEAMNDLLKALKNELKAKKDLKKNTFKFRSLKDETQSITVLEKHWDKHRSGVYANVFNSRVLRGHQPLRAELKHDSRLIRTRLGHYYLCLPKPLEILNQGESQAPPMSKHATISLDPGVRTFMTGYDADGGLCEWGESDMGRIGRLCHAHDDLQKRWSQPEVRHHQRYRMKVAARRIRLKIRNLVDELHKHLAKWLCENYRCVLIPEFQTSQMVRKGQRKLRSKTARAMLTWAHYRFRQRLLSKAREYPWCQVIVTQEPYTSKTCGACGWIHNKLGGSKVFRCGRCPYVADRDANGARNILLRHLTINKKRVED